MKKNISINISGIIFHIEEDGYENLRRYLDSITKYFASFEDSSEIMADIESRIAEIFLSRLNEGKQVITVDDVNNLITTMGSVSDFKAAEETEPTPNTDNAYTNSGQNTYAGNTTGNTGYTSPRSLMRDQKRKILGGVCTGIANYMNIDPLWVRLVFAILAFAWGFTIFVYIIMWIIVPGSYDLTETEVGKKMYRDGERKVLGGVSGGVASYLNTDILAVRIVFILLALAGGFGFFLYIILWVILPEARTLTDRMQMQGEPVTLSNIESTIKKNQESPTGEESALTKVLLFPFRLIGMVLHALAKAIGPLAQAIRVLFGVFVVFLGLTLLASILMSSGVAIGLFSNTFDGPWQLESRNMNIPVEAFLRAFPGWTLTAAFFAAIIPVLVLILLGISIVARRIVFSSTIGWTMFAVFLVCVGMLSVGIPKIIYAFKEEGEFKIEKTYSPTGKTAVLKVNEVGLDDYHGAMLNLEGHTGTDFKLVQVFKSQGTTRALAMENAKMVDYNVVVQDSVFTFDSNVTFRPDAIFRAQEVYQTLYIPYDFPFTLDAASGQFIDEYIEWDYRDGHTWKMTKTGLECISCPKPTQEELAREELRNFDQLDLHGIFDVRIFQGDEYAVELKGPEAEKNKYNIYRSGKTLIIDFEGKKNFNWDWNSEKVLSDQVYISITMPDLEKIEATGFGSIEIEERNASDMEIEIRGPIKLHGKIWTEDMNINLTGKSEVELEGRSGTLNASLEFASKLKAYNFEVTDANIEATGASTAKVNVTHRLEIEEGMASDIDFRGNPEVINHKN